MHPASRRVIAARIPTYLDEGKEVVVPGLHAAARGQCPHPHLALLDSVALPDIAVIGAVSGRALLCVFVHGVMQSRLVGFELAQHVRPSSCYLINCFFAGVARPT